MSPEQALWLEVILQAVHDLVDRSSERAQWRREALEWIFADDDEVGSFLFCCSAINADASAIRHGLKIVDRKVLKKRVKVRSDLIQRRVDRLDDPAFDCNDGAYSPLRALNW